MTIKRLLLALALVLVPATAEAQTQAWALPATAALDGSERFWMDNCTGAGCTQHATSLQIQAYAIEAIDTEAELETLWGAVNIILETEMDTEVELEALLTDMANILQASEIDTEAKLVALMSDVADIIETVEINTEAKLEAIMGAINMIVSTEIDTETELEALVGDATDIFTDNDIDFVVAASMGDADHGDVTWASGVATVDGHAEGTAFPGSPATGDYFVILDDSVGGACDSGAGTANTKCRWSGAAWEAVGDGNAASDATDDGTFTICDGSSGDCALVFNGDAGTDCTITHTVATDTFALSCALSTPRTATPGVALGDSDTTDSDDNVVLDGNCTDTGSGTEDCDFFIKQQIAGALTTRATFDADGKVSIPDLTVTAHHSALFEDLAAADVNKEIFMANDAVTITGVGCHCNGTCSTPAQISFEDRAGNALTHATLTCGTGAGVSTFIAVTATGALTAGEGLRFDVDNAVSPETDEYTIAFTATADAE